MKRVPQPSTGVTTALIYTRVSSDEQAREGVSLDAQLAECRRYAAAHGWVIGGEYQDVLSGTRDDRPQYQALLGQVRIHRADARPVTVVVAALDRFGRRVLERVRCREELKALGVPVHSVREHGEVPDVVANMFAAMAQEEVRRLGERVSASRRHLSAQGWMPPGRASWGYKWRSATAEERAAGAPATVLDVDSDAAPYVKEAFARLARGESVRSVGRWAAELPASARGGRRLAFKVMCDLARSPTYVARPAHGESDVLARPMTRWPTLISDEMWHKAQEAINRHGKTPRQASGRYLLTGLLRCPRCGARMAGRSRYNAPAKYKPQYYCTGYLRGANAPDSACRWTTPQRSLDPIVLDHVSIVLSALGQPDIETSLRRAWDHLASASTNDSAERIAALERHAEKARKRLAEAARLLVDGTLDKHGYEAMRDEERAALEAAEKEVARLRRIAPAASLPPLDTVLREAGGWSRPILEADVLAQRQVLAALVEEIRPIRGDRRGEYTAHIAWSAVGIVLEKAATMLKNQTAA